MIHLNLHQPNKVNGFTLIEVMVTVIILGIMAAITAPSLVDSWRQAKANEALNQLRSSLQQAQANANRLSRSCTVTVNSDTNDYTISGSPSGCLQETITIDRNIVDISSSSSSNPWTVSFTIRGTTTNQQTFTIARKNSLSGVDSSNANCLVVSNGLGLVRTGKKNGTSCINVNNIRYDNENP